MKRLPTLHMRRALGLFARNEDGTIVIFAVMMTVLMFILAGMGLDIMRYETVRTELQQTLDRSTLASASMTQTLDPESVVRDYFAKAGLSENLTKVQVTTGLNFRNVRAEAAAEIDPFFLDMTGSEKLDKLEMNGVSVAEQRITNVEIMLVLDVSGSMAGTRMTNLKNAANEFLTTVLSSDKESKISVGIVPYNGQVNMTQTMQNLFTGSTNDHNVANVNCFDLPASVYSSSGISTSAAMPVTADVDTYSTTSTSNSYVSITSSNAVVNAGNKWCPPSTANVILPPTNNLTTLRNHINGLTAVGATSTNAGMKWGLAMLDPNSRGMFNSLVTAGQIPTAFRGRPYNYDDEEAMKLIVLMTDGEHFAEERVNAGYRTETAPIWRANDGNYSIFHASQVNSTNATTICNSRPYWVPHLGQWHSRAWTGSAPSGSACYVVATQTWTGTTRQTWNQLWATVRMSWVAWQLYARPLNRNVSYYNQIMDMFRTKTPTSTMDTQLQSICSFARTNSVIVYGIAFEAPTNGQNQIKACATTTNHYYDAAGLEISTAFRSIANNISQLRLTQ